MTTIKLKNGSGAPTAGDLVQGEPALDLTNKRLYTEDSGGTVIEVGTNPTSVTTGDITATGTATFAGLTTTADVSFGDNDKAIFGAGSDLQIYHTPTGNHSIIAESGAGNLILAADNLEINNAANNANKIVATSGGAVTLYHNNSAKLATTSTGIDVTGSISADGLTVGDASSSFSGVYILSSTTGESELRMGDTDTDAGSIAYTNSDDTMTFRAAAGPRMSLDSSGIDVTGTVTADGLTVDGTSDLNGTITVGTTYTTNITGNDIQFFRNNGASYIAQRGGHALALQTNDGSDRTRLNIEANGDIGFYEDTGTTAKLFWDASAESLGIGTSSPDRLLDVEPAGTVSLQTAKFTTGNSDGNFNVGFANGSGSASNTEQGALVFNYGTTRIGAIGFNRGGGADCDAIAFFTSTNDEAMRIDSSGNLLVGKTSTSIDTAGIALRSADVIQVTRDGDKPLELNRLSSDGTIAAFYKDGGSPVGSIGTAAGSAFIDGNSSSAGLFFAGASVLPRDGGVGSNGGVDLGESSYRWKDLYLSGGAYLGGTSSANKLDDYEEGTWTPNISRLTTEPTVTYINRVGTYTKIGRLVTVYFDVDASSISGGSGNARLSGLPFTISNTMAGYSKLVMRDTAAVASGGTESSLSGYAEHNTTYAAIQIDYNGSSGYGFKSNPTWNASGRITGFLTYEAA